MGELDKAVNELEKAALNLGFLPTGCMLIDLIGCRGDIFEIFGRENIVKRTLNDRYNSFFDLLRLSKPERIELLADLVNGQNESNFFRALSNRICEGDTYGLDLGVADHFLAFNDTCLGGNYDLVKEDLNRITALNHAASLNINLKIKYVEFCLDQNQIGTALAVMADLVVQDTALSGYLPFDEVIPNRKWRSISSFSHDISLPIVLDTYFRLSQDDKVGTLRHYSVRQVLDTNGIAVPSEMGQISYNSDKEKLVYFLKYVCVESVLDMLPALKGTSEVREERIRIYEVLSQLDSENTDAYQDEIVALITIKEKEEGLSLVDSSRLHVNMDAIERWAVSEFSESFDRYAALVNAGVGSQITFNEMMRMVHSQDTRKEKIFEFPENEADLLLLSIIYSIRDHFLLDTTDGLDSYLSTRVRHDAVHSYLRSPVEAAKLITQKSDKLDQRYAPNLHWLDKLSTLTELQKKKISSAFDNFSKEFDSLLMSLNDRQFQVKSDDHPHGLFYIDLTPQIFQLIRSLIAEDMQFHTFLSVCVGAFWASLEKSLEEARAYLSTTVKSEFDTIFSKLRTDLTEHAYTDQNFPDLSKSIGDTATLVNSEIEDIVGWFKRSDLEQAGQTYEISKALDIAIESALSSHSNFSPKLNHYVSGDLKLSTAGVFVLADIIRVGIGNVFKHGGVIKEQKIRVACEAKSNSQTINLEIENQVGSSVNFDQSNHSIKTIKDLIFAGDYKTKVRSEGGSGFLKIANSVTTEDHKFLDFGFTKQNTFLLQVRISAKELNLIPFMSNLDQE